FLCTSSARLARSWWVWSWAATSSARPGSMGETGAAAAVIGGPLGSVQVRFGEANNRSRRPARCRRESWENPLAGELWRNGSAVRGHGGRLPGDADWASAQQRGQLGETADHGHPLVGGLGTLLVGGESSAIDPRPEQSGAGGADRIRVQPIADVASLRRLDTDVASRELEDACIRLRHPHLAARDEVAERDERIQSGSDDLRGLEGEVAVGDDAERPRSE